MPKNNHAEQYKQQWEANGLIMSGKQLSDIIGCSMPKIRLVIDRGLFGFPKPAKVRPVGNRKIYFYSRESIASFMARVDLKNTVVPYNAAKKAGDIATSRQIDTSLYFEFMGVKSYKKIQEWGIGTLEWGE